MSQNRQELELAKELIEEKEYDKARLLLHQIPSDPTAQKWLDKLDAIAPPGARSSVGGDVESSAPWQYVALEVKRSYGIQYRVNGEAKADWKDQPIYYPLNELGREGWELIGFETNNEMSTYLLKKPGAALDNQKIDVWDQ